MALGIYSSIACISQRLDPIVCVVAGFAGHLWDVGIACCTQRTAGYVRVALWRRVPRKYQINNINNMNKWKPCVLKGNDT